MSTMSGKRIPLRIIRGGRDDLYMSGLRVTLVARDEMPVAAEAVVVEEDTWQVVAAPPEWSEEREHPIRLMRALANAQPLEPGTVFVREGTPLTFIAVIYDLAEEAVCRPEWIGKALARLMVLAEEREIRSFVLPLPGVRHGNITIPDAVALLVSTLRQQTPARLQRIWLAAATDDHATVRHCWPAPERSTTDDDTA